MHRMHAIVGAIMLVLLPLGSLLWGSGIFAWTMYSGTGEYRIEIRVRDERGWRSVAPTGLAEAASESAAGVLSGADHFRRGPLLDVLRSHLGELATFACRQRGGIEADVELHERKDATGPERVTRAHRECR